MPCKREARKRHNTIAFWLDDEEKERVEARIKVAGIPKGEYYRKAVLGEQVNIVAGRYKSDRLAKALERIHQETEVAGGKNDNELRYVLEELLEAIKK